MLEFLGSSLPRGALGAAPSVSGPSALSCLYIVGGQRQFQNRRIRLTQVYTIYGISTTGVYPREFHLQIQEQ